MPDLLAAIPGPVWLLAVAMVALGAGVTTWFAHANRTAPLDTELWDGGEHGAEPPLHPAWREEVW